MKLQLSYRRMHFRVLRRTLYALDAALLVFALSATAVAEDAALPDPSMPGDKTFLLVCIQPDFAIRIKTALEEFCHWTVLADLHERQASKWPRYFLEEAPAPQGKEMFLPLPADSWQPPTPAGNIEALPISAQILLDFNIMKDDALSFYPASRTSLNWRFRRATGMTGPYFTNGYVDKPFRRVGVRFILDY